MKIDLQKLEYALAVARHRSFSKAADALGLTQPTLTRNIQALEKDIGGRIFDRSRAGVETTPTGALLLERGAELAGAAYELERDLQLFRGAGIGKLSIGAGPYPAAISVGRAVAALVAEQPSLEIDLVVGDWLTMRRLVLDRRIDLAVIELTWAEEDARFLTQPMQIHSGLFFCRKDHPLEGKVPLTLSELGRFPLVATVMPPRLAELRRRDTAQTPAGDFFYPTIRADTIGAVMDIVLGSDAIGFLTAGLLLEPWRLGKLVVLPLDLPTLTSNYGIISLAGRTPSPSALRFIDIAKRVDSQVLRENIAAGKKILSDVSMKRTRPGKPGDEETGVDFSYEHGARSARHADG